MPKRQITTSFTAEDLPKRLLILKGTVFEEAMEV